MSLRSIIVSAGYEPESDTAKEGYCLFMSPANRLAHIIEHEGTMFYRCYGRTIQTVTSLEEILELEFRNKSFKESLKNYPLHEV